MFDEYDERNCERDFFEVEADPAQSDLEEINFDDLEPGDFEDSH